MIVSPLTLFGFYLQLPVIATSVTQENKTEFLEIITFILNSELELKQN